jgi:hypothetical protein
MMSLFELHVRYFWTGMNDGDDIYWYVIAADENSVFLNNKINQMKKKYGDYEFYCNEIDIDVERVIETTHKV